MGSPTLPQRTVTVRHLPHPKAVRRAPKALTPKEAQFVQAYLGTESLAEAARIAGYTLAGAQTALARPRVALAVEDGRRRWSEALSVTRERLVAELAAIAYLDPLDVLRQDERGIRVKLLSEIPERARRAISSIRTTKTGTLEVRFIDKLEAARLLAQVSGWLDSKTYVDARTQVLIPALAGADLATLRAMATAEDTTPFDDMEGLPEAKSPVSHGEGAHAPEIPEPMDDSDLDPFGP